MDVSWRPDGTTSAWIRQWLTGICSWGDFEGE